MSGLSLQTRTWQVFQEPKRMECHNQPNHLFPGWPQPCCFVTLPLNHYKQGTSSSVHHQYEPSIYIKKDRKKREEKAEQLKEWRQNSWRQEERGARREAKRGSKEGKRRGEAKKGSEEGKQRGEETVLLGTNKASTTTQYVSNRTEVEQKWKDRKLVINEMTVQGLGGRRRRVREGENKGRNRERRESDSWMDSTSPSSLNFGIGNEEKWKEWKKESKVYTHSPGAQKLLLMDLDISLRNPWGAVSKMGNERISRWRCNETSPLNSSGNSRRTFFNCIMGTKWNGKREREREEKERYIYTKQEHEMMEKKKRKENNKPRMAEGRKIITKTGLMKFNLIILFPIFFHWNPNQITNSMWLTWFSSK